MTGGRIVVLLTALLVLAMVFAPKYSILVQEFRKRSMQTLEDEYDQPVVVG